MLLVDLQQFVAANVALNIKTLGGQVTLLSVVGQDEPARRLQQARVAGRVAAHRRGKRPHAARRRREVHAAPPPRCALTG